MKVLIFISILLLHYHMSLWNVHQNYIFFQFSIRVFVATASNYVSKTCNFTKAACLGGLGGYVVINQLLLGGGLSTLLVLLYYWRFCLHASGTCYPYFLKYNSMIWKINIFQATQIKIWLNLHSWCWLTKKAIFYVFTRYKLVISNSL